MTSFNSVLSIKVEYTVTTDLLIDMNTI